MFFVFIILLKMYSLLIVKGNLFHNIASQEKKESCSFFACKLDMLFALS